MIASLRGDVLHIGSDHLVVDVNGVGLRVFTPNSVVKTYQLNDRVFLFTHLVVREDALSLYGFETERERDLFVLLLGVNGVGPRTALATLSTLSVDVIRNAVISEQVDAFARVSGVGRKTGQKIIIALQGKISGGDSLEAIAGFMDVDSEVLGALTALGYSVVEAQSAIQTIPRDAPKDVETRLRLALQFFSS
jgi:holliday junction DNA helicase RuvA